MEWSGKMFVRQSGCPELLELVEQKKYVSNRPIEDALISLQREFLDCNLAAEIRRLLRERAGLYGAPASDLAAAISQLPAVNNLLMEGLALILAKYGEKQIRQTRYAECQKRDSSKGVQGLRVISDKLQTRQRCWHDDLVAKMRVFQNSSCDEVRRCFENLRTLAAMAAARLRESVSDFCEDEIRYATASIGYLVDELASSSGVTT
jgi:hypothetical protein